MVHRMLAKITLNNMANFRKVLDGNKTKDTQDCSEMEKKERSDSVNHDNCTHQETFYDFCKHNHFLIEEVPLHSKSIARMTFQRGDELSNWPLREYLKSPLKVYAPVEEIRNQYGDEIAIYFEWMNHL